ncbi:ATPase components of ABC transporters with duplicated ATPase domains [Bowdeniella nasicola]|uniref:ATPase components of ABC transporters with duplicated ATPase domains n=1 Tax=Bowdeniella nasicola TaxID=208480 RepID=A0A1H4A8L0_9ACTO|nr:ABC-F family ATP-binding cassette domain-containing protein [Bowdeniella nasicola]SEA32276.1 ATPase components of ABC transporters with duplicated ATPase domains [Bowdeniella nasicola]
MAIPLIVGESLHLDYPTRTVFNDVTLGVEEGDRIGIVGRNGDGKSSLLNMLTGALEPHGGRVTRRGGIRVGHLTQADPLPEGATVRTAIVGDAPEHEWAADPAIRDVLAGLVSDLAFDAPVANLSGGQRRRVALAALLVGDYDVLALDEPTNHLDVEGIAWLAGHLKRRWPTGAGALLVITHDRWFLDEVCTETWEVHDGIVEPFEGGYAAYVLQRVERDRIKAATEAKRQNLLRKELAWLRRGAPARTSKPKFRIDAANQLIEDVPPIRNPLELKSLAVSRLGKRVIDLDDVSFSFDAKPAAPVLRDVTWHIAPGERTGILGANGSGKTTLLNLIAGSLSPTAGRIRTGTTVRIGHLDQQFSQLAAIATDRVREVLARTKASFTVDGKDLTPAQLLERLGFAREHLSARVGELSGGQKRRLQLLLLLLAEPNVIILDEPTNDVDADMLAALEDLLDSWPGTLLVVSHDRYLMERVTDQQYAILDGRLRHLPGGVEEYLRLRSAEQRGGASAPASPASPSAGSIPAATTLSGAAIHAAQKEVASIERRLAKIGTEVERVHQEMAEHDQSDYEGLQVLTRRLNAFDAETAELEDRWLELTEEIG